MPAGHPEESDILDGTVSFFSIDTDLIQAAGYRFGEGILGLLPKVSPVTMRLLITEIVEREVVTHLLRPILNAQGEFQKAVNTLKKSEVVKVDELTEVFGKLNLVTSAEANFRKRIETYVAQIRGEILPIKGDDLASLMFDLYFDVQPPFEENKEKKAEFPDAASLLLLEQYASDECTIGIVASKDKGAKKFAERSDYLYHVESLDELSNLFKTTGARADAITRHLRESLDDSESLLYKTLNDALVDHVGDAEWDIEDAVSGIASRVETEFVSAYLADVVLDAGSAKVWNDTKNRATWVVEVVARLTVSINVDLRFYVWDSIDREELELTSDSVDIEKELEVSAFITCSGALDDADPTTWHFEVDIAQGQYFVKLGEVSPDLG